jgi:hypothetical protein
MDFSKLKLAHHPVPKKEITESVETPSEKPTRVEHTSFDVTSLIRKKELIHMRESNRVSWRQELEEENEKEHPYVDVMPGGEPAHDIRKLLKGVRKKKSEDSNQTVL